MSTSQSSHPQPMNQPNKRPVHTTLVTSEQIQALLDENQTIIGEILEKQKSSKESNPSPAVLQCQLKLQQNLLLLASMADQSSN